MKQYLVPVIFMALLCTAATAYAQNDRSKRPSPPAAVSQKLETATININYSQPSVKGRTIGVDVEPLPGQVWRAGANEATVFETDNDITIEGKLLPKGKYGFFILMQDENWTLIFNKTWNQWGAFRYKESDDVLRVTVTEKRGSEISEKLVYKITPEGDFIILWGNRIVTARIK